MTRRDFIYTAPALATLALARETAAKSTLRLWYRQPATRWLDALPIGNGRLAAMVFGSIEEDKIQLNEATLWSGAPNSANLMPAARPHLAEIRRLLFEGKYVEANKLCSAYFVGREDAYGTHLPMASLVLRMAGATPGFYRRELDIEQGIAGVEYMLDGCTYKRELFASNPDNVIAVRLTCNRPGRISCVFALNPGELPGEVNIAAPGVMALAGSAFEDKHSDGKMGVNFQAWARVIPEGGTLTAATSTLQIEHADAVTILVAANTNYRDGHAEQLCREQLATSKSYDELRRDHIADHGRLFQRVSIDLSGESDADLATDERLAAVAKGRADPQLAALFFQYGRYLLIAGSRPNSPLPLNLQGIWNDGLASKMGWTCDFHLDINTQQNYWPSENCNLAECNEPLFTLIENIAKEGHSTARDLYGAHGWVCHVYTNAWGFTAPGKSTVWGLFPTAGVWAAMHLWEHYRFSNDRQFLAQRAYPILRSAAEFFLDYLVAEPKHGWLVTGPSISPENQFEAPTGEHCSVSMGPTCDRVLVYALFSACIEACGVLAIDKRFQETLKAAREKLSPIQVGKHGQIREWLEDFDEVEPNHRHTSHLLSLYPFDQITPALATAARATLDRKLSQPNWEDVEWSRANLINFFARLGDGDAALKHLHGLLREDTDHNLLTFSRGGVAGAAENIFAIDGNTAGTAGIAEMLLQSHREVHFLPALPTAWASGSVKGLKARGGFEVAITWASGVLQSAAVGSLPGGRARVRYQGKTAAVNIPPGGSVKLDGSLRVTSGA